MTTLGQLGRQGRPSGIWLLVALLTIIHSFLVFYGLGSRPLWQDEAETAILAKNVLKFGAPLAYDGKNLVSQEKNQEFGKDYVWRWSGWSQIYIAALSFRLFGCSTFTARLLFAMIGVSGSHIHIPVL